MNKYLSISIPTFNRPNILDASLKILVPQARDHHVPIYISDDSNNHETQKVINKYIKQYKFLFYNHNNTSLGHDKNIIQSLLEKETKYIWLLGDSTLIADNAIGEIINLIQRYSPNIIVCNSRDRTLDCESELIQNKDYALENFGWHTTLTGTTIYSQKSTLSARYLDLKEFKNFPHIGIIFRSLIDECSFYWESKQLIWSHKDKESYWSKNIFETFITDFYRAIFFLPEQYPLELKAKITPIHSIKSRIFDSKSLLVLRSENIFNIIKFRKFFNALKLNSNTNVIIIFLIAILPISILKFLRIFFRKSLKS